MKLSPQEIKSIESEILEKLNPLSKKYELSIAIIAWSSCDAGRDVIVIGNACMVCASDILTACINDNEIKHTDENEKETIN